MTLSSTTTKTTYSGDGATTQFATGFKFLKNSHVKAILRDENASPVTETTWVEGTHYTLTGAGDAAGGTVTVKTTPTDYTPQTGEKLIVKRNAPETQGTALPAGGAFPSGSVEEMVDHATMLAQQHSEELARVLSFAETSPTSAVAMPEPNGNDVIGWDGSGGLTNYDSSGFSGPQGPAGADGDMANPMTARGDIITGDAAGPGDPQRLGL
ncbi:MAG: phage tail fiber protein, partial [Rhodospirillales bacterium]|nr:phage tail fiber protein [Rhodospirillales bacterium]